MNYTQKANPNATNSELDAKRIIIHKQLTSEQRDELIEQFVEIVVNNMDSDHIAQIVTELLEDQYDKCSDIELKECVDNYNSTLYDELVDDVTTQTTEVK